MSQLQKKLGLHPRNKHLMGYPISALLRSYPALQPYIVRKADNSQTINFADPNGVKVLNAALLAHYYQVHFWDFPPGYLCPPIPGRADYVHYIADLLAIAGQAIPTGKKVKGLDIGTGANLVYPIIANRSYGWSMLGTDIDTRSIKSAKTIVSANSVLKNGVKLRLQQTANIFRGVVEQNEQFDFCMCNPPFHRSAAEAQAGSKRKVRNLSRHAKKRQSGVANTSSQELNFAGQPNELWCEGGELAFIQSMITESVEFSQQINWFTCLVSNKKHLPPLLNSLQYVNAIDAKTIDMAQGQKVSRFIAWRFKQQPYKG